MADIESNINLNIDTSDALASLRSLQRQISTFQQTMSKTGAVSSAQLGNLQQNLINGINSTGQFSATMQRVTTTTESFTNSLEKNKFSMGQYFKYAGAATKTFGKMFSGEFDTIEKVARERVKTLQTQYIKLGRDASGAMQAIQVRPQVLDMKDLGTQTAIANQKAQLFNQLMKQGSTELLNFGKNTQWAGRQLMVGFTIPLGIMGAAAAKEFKAIEEQVIRLERVYGDFTTTMSDTKAITADIKDLAGEFTKYGVAVSKTIGLAADAAAMGKTGADLVAQVAEANRLAVLGGVDQQKSLETTISLTNSFGIASDQLAGKINFLNAVENQTVTSIDDLTEAIPKAGPVVQQLGGNVEDLTFFLTAMKEGGINASEGANALKSGLASLINPTEEASTMLNGFGINLQGIVDANKGNVKGIVVDFAKALDTLDPLNRAQAIEQLFGKFQFSRLSTLFQNVIAEGSQASRVLELTKSSSEQLAALSQRELARIEDSPLYKFEGAIESFKAAMAPIGETFMKAVTPIINFGTDLLNKFNEMSDGGKQFVVILTGAVAGLGPILLMTFGLIANGVANLIKGFMFVKNIFSGTGKSSQLLTDQLSYMTSEQLQASAVAASLGQVHTNLIQTFNAEAGAIRNLAAAYGSGIAAQNAFMGPIVSGRGRTPKKMATGGMVPGSGNGDTVPAMLTPGEFVLTKDVVSKYPGLIAGMMSGKVGMFNGGGSVEKPQQTHMAGGMDISIPNVAAQVERLAPGLLAVMSDIEELGNSVEVLSDLVAEKSKTLNQKAKAGGMGADEFEAEWAKDKNGFLGTAQRAAAASGTTLSQAEIDDLDAFDNELGAKIASRIRESAPADMQKPGWLDEMIADETGKMLDEGLNGKDGVRKEVAKKLQSRKDTVATIRTKKVQNQIDPDTGQPYGSAENYYAAMKRKGYLSERAGKVGLYAEGSDFQFARPSYDDNPARRDVKREQQLRVQRAKMTGADPGVPYRTNSLTTGAFSSMVLGGTYERPMVTPEQVAKARAAGAKAVTTQLDTFVDALVVTAQTASPSKRTMKVAKDTVDGFVIGLEDGKQKTKAVGKTVVPSIFNTPGAQNLRDKFPKIVGNVPNLQQAQMAAYGGTNILKGKELQFARGAKLLDSAQMLKPMVMLNAAMTTTGTAIKTAAINVKDFGIRTGVAAKEIATKIPGALRNLADSAKKTAMSIATSAKQIWSGTTDANGNVIKPGIKNKMAGAGMAAGMGLMMMSGQEGPMGDIARTVSGPLMAISALGPVLSALPPQAQVAVGAVAVVGAAFVFLQDQANKANDAARKVAQSLSTGKDAMDKFAEATGAVNPVDAIAQKRAQEKAGRALDTGKDSFGSQFMGSDAGKELLQSAQSSLNQLDGKTVAEKVAAQLATAVSGGLMSADQARSVADNMSVALKDSTFSTNIDASLLSLIGKDGKNVLENPLQLEVKLIESNAKEIKTGIQDLADTPAPIWWFGATDDEMNKRAANEAGVAQSIRDQADAEKQALANAELRHDAKIKELKAANDLAGIEKENAKYDKERKDILTASATEMKAMSDQLNAKDRQVTITDELGNVTDQYYSASQSVNGMIDQLEQMTKDSLSKLSEAEKKVADKTVESIANSQYLQSGTKATLMASIDIQNIDAFNDLKSMFDPSLAANAKVYQYVAEVSTKVGTEAAGTVTEVLASFGEGNEAKAMNFIANVDAGTTEGMDMINTIQTMKDVLGDEFSIDMVVDAKGNPTQELKDVSNAYADIRKKIDAGGPITLSTITSIDWSGVKDMGALQGWFDSIPKEQQKFFLEHFVSVYASITDDEIDEYMKGAGISGAGKAKDKTYIGGGRYASTGNEYTAAQRTQYKAAATADQVKKLTTAMADLGLFDTSSGGNTGPSAPPPPTGGGGGGGAANEQAAKAPASFLDDIVKKVRQVTTGAVNLTDEFATSWATINGLFGAGSPTNVFAGLEQQMRGLGASEDIISLITGMSLEEWDQRKNDLFNFDASGNITGFKDMLNSISRALTAVKLGEFQSKQQQTLKTTVDQANAISKIVAAGASYAQAYEMVQDAATAAAIAQETNIEKIKEIIRIAQEAAAALSLMSASQSVAQSNQDATDMNKTISFLTNYGGALSDAQTEAILKSKELQTMLKNFDTLSIDQLRQLDEALRNADLQAEVELKTKMLTAEGMQQVFQDGFGKAMEAFSTQEQEIKLKFKVLRNPFEEVVSGFQDKIEKLKNAPGGLDDLEADLQRIGEKEIDINKKYEARFKALDEIQKANDKIAAQQRTQLSLADALSMGDIGAAARAAQEMRAQETAQALVDQRDALKKSQELEIAQLQGEMGMSREQLEANIRNIKTQIFEIEEKSIEPAQFQLELLKKREEAEIAALTVLGKTKDEWDQIKSNTDMARIASEQYNEAMNNTVNVADDLIAKWAEITAPKETLHTIIEKKVSDIAEADRLRKEQADRDAAAEAARRAAQQAQTSTATPAAPAGLSDADIQNYARRVIRGEFGNGQARRNALAAIGVDYQTIQDRVNRILYQGYAAGGLVNYLAKGGSVAGREKIGSFHIPRAYAGGFTRYATGGTVAGPFKKMGTDTVPAMLTPGEFVVKKYAVENFGVDNLKAINDGTYKSGSVYNNTYSINVNARTNANADDIARTVIAQIKQVDAQRIRGNRF